MLISKEYNKNKINIYIINNAPYFQENQINKILKLKKSIVNRLLNEDNVLNMIKNKNFKSWIIDIIDGIKSSRSVISDWENIP
jgi:hypothetical protein